MKRQSKYFCKNLCAKKTVNKTGIVFTLHSPLLPHYYNNKIKRFLGNGRFLLFLSKFRLNSRETSKGGLRGSIILTKSFREWIDSSL